MYAATDPLVFPPHFPPTNRWKKFFIGVRGLGPDLSFFKNLKQQQSERVQSQMDVWGSGMWREIAEQLSQEFKTEVRWPTSVFLPSDSFKVMCNGPSFGMVENLGSVAVIQHFEKSYGVRVPRAFWDGRENATFGEIVEALAALLGPAVRGQDLSEE